MELRAGTAAAKPVAQESEKLSPPPNKSLITPIDRFCYGGLQEIQHLWSSPWGRTESDSEPPTPKKTEWSPRGELGARDRRPSVLSEDPGQRGASYPQGPSQHL